MAHQVYNLVKVCEAYIHFTALLPPLPLAFAFSVIQLEEGPEHGPL